MFHLNSVSVQVPRLFTVFFSPRPPVNQGNSTQAGRRARQALPVCDCKLENFLTYVSFNIVSMSLEAFRKIWRAVEFEKKTKRVTH